MELIETRPAEPVHELPAGWARSRIGELFSFLRTANNSRRDLTEDGDVYYIHYGDIHTRIGSHLNGETQALPLIHSHKVPRADYLEDGDLVLADASEDLEGIGKGTEVHHIAGKRIVAGLHTFLLRGDREELADGFKGLIQFIPEFRASLERIATGTSVYGISKSKLAEVEIPLPPLPEQRAIAAALSDVDNLIDALDRLIAKKRAVKTAAMQQLLTGRQRLPGFRGAWEMMTLGDVVNIVSGATPRSDIPSYWNGRIAWCTPTDITGTSDKYLTETERTITEEGLASSSARLLPKGTLLLCSRATIGELKIAAVPVTTNQGFKSLICGPSIDNEFLYYLVLTMKPMMIERATGSTFLEISRKNVAALELSLPSLDEQKAIATVLTDMDAEIAALETRRDKTKQIKQGMMQELLTGRTRLVQPGITEKRAHQPKGHNWAFDEAVVLANLADRFGSPQYPLGRKRRTKLFYLFHRHVQQNTGRTEQPPEGFLKKAAGPYKPQTRYGGPETIAQNKKYVREARSGKYTGFLAGENIDEAQGYFTKWYDREALEWLEQFRYVNNDLLGALTTVDFALLELRAHGEEPSVEGVKRVLAEDEAWKPKLKQAAFSEQNIERAILQSAQLFGL